ncbi:serine/threonine-protein kinase pak-2-like isoform X2 [Paramacrobiotus metropolitanus]|uniref:serine/threonine-protein kinase pak-2-like isoform X2 n=1 Tax=Paramacrobiotus metropolitanus TaxID=2943436 RepID=UPI002446214F|nr:serine/threonine-protein kinase pak-2-like isoform X2 [Paramacrobiotus metropolitanus]
MRYMGLEYERLNLKDIRTSIRNVVDSEFTPGNIFRDNVVYFERDNGEKIYSLDSCKDFKSLWMEWRQNNSSNIIYIPPEVFLRESVEEKNIDSWTIGCLLVQLLNDYAPLQLVRHWRYSKEIEYFRPEGEDIMNKLKQFYTEVPKEKGLIIGPLISFPEPVPISCEDFLARCLELDPGKRESLDKLKLHPFLDMTKSINDLRDLDKAYYRQPLPITNKFKVTNVRNQPFLRSDPAVTVQLGDLHYENAPGLSQKAVDIWRFTMFDEKKDGDSYTKAFGKLLHVLDLENSGDTNSKERTSFYGIRALQKGHENIVHHFGCQFKTSGTAFALPEFQVFAEHCPGGTFQEAANYYLPIQVVQKWLRSMLCGLEFLHSHGIIHRNLSSGMVFFSEAGFKGTVKIGGFHNMRQLESERTTRHEISARPGLDGRFVAPEIVNSYDGDVNIGRKSDIWSFGCVALHLLSGQPPLYTGAKDKPIAIEMAVLYHLNSTVEPLPHFPEWIPIRIKGFLKECLKFQPEHRPTASDILKNDSVFPLPDSASINKYDQNRSVGPKLDGSIITYWENFRC